jgi:hypothetical protein
MIEEEAAEETPFPWYIGQTRIFYKPNFGEINFVQTRDGGVYPILSLLETICINIMPICKTTSPGYIQINKKTQHYLKKLIKVKVATNALELI